MPPSGRSFGLSDRREHDVANRLAQQLARPAGLLGRQVSRQMETANRGMVNAALQKLDARAGHHVLEIGFGRGRTLDHLVEASQPGGRVTGIDHSELMVRTARRHLRRHLRDQTLEIVEGDAHSLPVSDASVDRLLAVNTVTYWPEPVAGLVEVARVLRPAGIAVVAVRAPAVLSALRITGPGVHHLGRDDLVAIAVDAGLHAEQVTDGVDRTGGYFIARMRLRPPKAYCSQEVPPAQAARSSTGLAPTAARGWLLGRRLRGTLAPRGRIARAAGGGPVHF